MKHPLLLLLFNLILLGSASAQHASPVTPSGAHQSRAAHQDLLLQKLQTYPEAWEFFRQEKFADAIEFLEQQPTELRDANYYNLMGVLHTKLRKYEVAAVHFEQAVLLEPENAGSWLDLAIASAESGNVISAQSYFDYIEVNFAPPQEVKRVIEHFRRQLQAQFDGSLEKQGVRWTHRLDAHVGTDSNVNSGLASLWVPVTLGNDRFSLILDPSSQARADRYGQLAYVAKYIEKGERTDFSFDFLATYRAYREQHEFSSGQLGSAVGWQTPIGSGVGSLNLALDLYHMNGTALLYGYRIPLSWERRIERCALGGGIEAERRDYRVDRNLTGNLWWSQISGACMLGGGDSRWILNLIARFGLDRPVYTRAGGATNWRELGLGLSYKQGRDWQADVLMANSRAQDKEGYSAILENSAHRLVTKNLIRLQLSRRIATNYEMLVKLETNLVKSNLSIFSHRGTSTSLGMKVIF